MSSSSIKIPSLSDALIPLLSLIFLLALSVYLFGEDASYGANQIVLMLCGILAGVVGMKNGHSWDDIQEGMRDSIMMSVTAVLILLAVGMLIGCWIIAGTVPAMISYGLALLSPQVFYPASCLICAVVALSIGSSWTVAGTIGIGLIGVAQSMGLSLEITAGAIISGAYLGDKLSPLSDTTNLAASVAGAELFAHIRNLMWTTIPSFFISLILFSVLSIGAETTASESEINRLDDILRQQFHIGWYNLLPIVVVFVLAQKKWPALPTLIIGALSALVMALFFQSEAILRLAGDDADVGMTLTLVKGLWITAFDGYQSQSGNDVIDSLLSKGGMSSMLNTVWLIISAMMFGGAMERAGLLNCLLVKLLASVHSVGGLIRSLIFTGIGANIVTGDQFIAIVVPGRMYQQEFRNRKLHPLNLSRNLEDSATVTSVLIPWNTCGAYMAATLGVATHAYFLFAFFNLINPLIAIIYSYINFRILPLKQDSDLKTTETNNV
ncbi:MAG: Na+/H+ antiporter NhaC [Oceanicoccus sp.]